MSGQTALFEGVASVRVTSAAFDETRVYRYSLGRTWDSERERVNWIMLNPSTANETDDDPTIRRCEGFARAWGYGGIVVTNLFALRATDPRELYAHADPVGGERNDVVLRMIAHGAGLVVVAWGNHGAFRDRARDVAALLCGVDLRCLGVNKGGQPVHPLYQPKDAALAPWPTPESEVPSTQHPHVSIEDEPTAHPHEESRASSEVGET